MDIVSWNMGCGYGVQFRGTHDEAWRYLLDDLQPDVALLQEITLTPPLVVAGRGRLFAHGAWNGSCDWGSGVHVPAMPTQEVNAIASDDVHAVAASVEASGEPVVVMSVHVGTSGDNAAHADRLIRLADALGERSKDCSLVVAGDFNACRRYDERYSVKMCKPFFDRMETLGFFECHWRMHGREIQSFWRAGTVEPYQDDHFFVSPSLADRVGACEVIDNPEVRKLSDHGPVRLRIDL